MASCEVQDNCQFTCSALVDETAAHLLYGSEVSAAQTKYVEYTKTTPEVSSPALGDRHGDTDTAV